MRIEIFVGQRFNMLTVINEVERQVLPCGQKIRRFLVQCDCGNRKEMSLLHLRHYKIKSCGCINSPEHGDKNTNLYNIWRGMKNRVSKDYMQKQYYADKGITVNKSWGDYLTFKEWALNNGFQEGLTIDRIDNSKGYCPENCRFVTQEINNNNRDVTFRVGKNRTPLKLLLKELKLSNHYPAIYTRIKRGWDEDLAVSTPIRQGNYHSHNLI